MDKSWLVVIPLVIFILGSLLYFGKQAADCADRGGEYAKSAYGVWHCYEGRK